MHVCVSTIYPRTLQYCAQIPRNHYRLQGNVGLRMYMNLIVVAFITGNSTLEPLIEGLCAQIHVNLR